MEAIYEELTEIEDNKDLQIIILEALSLIFKFKDLKIEFLRVYEIDVLDRYQYSDHEIVCQAYIDFMEKEQMLKSQSELFDDDNSFGHEQYKFEDQKQDEQNKDIGMEVEQPAQFIIWVYNIIHILIMIVHLKN